MDPKYERLYLFLRRQVEISKEEIEYMMSFSKIKILKKKEFLFQEGEIALCVPISPIRAVDDQITRAA